MKSKHKIQVSINGKPRNLISLTQASKGDVYLRLYSGKQVGIPPNEIKVIEDRFSLHPSTKSEEFVTLKHTLKLRGKDPITSTALSDAVKSKNGFFHLFSHRATDLLPTHYDPAPTDSGESFILREFDPTSESLVISIFIGSTDVDFPEDSDWTGIRILNLNIFKIVILYSTLKFPSSPAAWTFASFTMPPSLFTDKIARRNVAKMMHGTPPSECIDFAKQAANELLANQIEFLASLTTDAEELGRLEGILATIPRVASLHI